MKSSEVWLHNNMNIINITELYTYKVKMVNLSFVLLFHYLKWGSFGMDVYTLLYVKWVIYCIVQGTLLSVTW